MKYSIFKKTDVSGRLEEFEFDAETKESKSTGKFFRKVTDGSEVSSTARVVCYNPDDFTPYYVVPCD